MGRIEDNRRQEQFNKERDARFVEEKRLKAEAEANKEIFKDIPDFPGYRMSNKGRIVHLVWIKPYEDRVFLTKDKKKYHIPVERLYKLIFG